MRQPRGSLGSRVPTTRCNHVSVDAYRRPVVRAFWPQLLCVRDRLWYRIDAPELVVPWHAARLPALATRSTSRAILTTLFAVTLLLLQASYARADGGGTLNGPMPVEPQSPQALARQALKERVANEWATYKPSGRPLDGFMTSVEA